MIEVSTQLIKQTVINLCYKANICLNNDVYSKILNSYQNTNNIELKSRLKLILKNAKIAYDEKMPLCQDTGQVIVFIEIGQNIILKGNFIEDEINSAVEECYCKNFFRKSIIKNSVFERINTKTNTPCIIYTKYTNNNHIKIKVLIKGAGSENKSELKMMLPTSSEDEIIKTCGEMVLKAGINACPPMFIGVGIGGTSDRALVLSKEALITKDFSVKEKILSDKIKEFINKKAPFPFEKNYVLDLKLKTEPTHIACMPVGITINCHADRYSEAIIKDSEIIYNHKKPDFIELDEEKVNIKEIKTDNITELSTIKEGENVLLTGEIYVARDMAHKKMVELLEQKAILPFEPKNKIIFYAGPCPTPKDKIIGSIGPTTAERMDKYAIKLYKKGIFATIGKGERSQKLKNYLKKYNKKYFTIQGGIAALLARHIKKSEIIAFEELGTEAIYKIYVEKFPVTLSI